MKIWVNGAVTVALLVGVPVASSAQSVARPAAADTQAMSKGVVKKIDTAQGKMTVAHGPLANLDMPAMTMLFRVADPAMLAAVKPGDEIGFKAEKVNGAFTITRLEPASASGVAPSPAVKPAVQPPASAPSRIAAAAMSTGVVQEVDAGQSEITIDHGPLPNLQMPAMTMVFRVADAKLLSGVKAGDNISFQAEKVNGDIVVTQLKKAQATPGASVALPAAQPPAAARTQTSAPSAQARTFASNASLSTGIVKKVDPDQGKVTVSHGPLANLAMPAMTMVFAVANREMIGNLKAGDSIEFAAERVNGALTITQLVPGKATSAPNQPAGSPSAVMSATAPSAGEQTAGSVSGQSSKAEAPTQQLGTPGDPTQANMGVIASPYQSAFSDYQPMQELADPPEKVWRAANDEVARLGGHVGQLREGTDNAPAALTGKPAAGMPGASAKAPAAHDMTQMKKDK